MDTKPTFELLNCQRRLEVLKEMVAELEARIDKLTSRAVSAAVRSMPALPAAVRSAPIVQPESASKPPVTDASPTSWFEETYGDCPTCGKTLRLIPPGRNRNGDLYDAFVGCTGYPSCRYARPLSARERDVRDGQREEHHDAHLPVDHRSTNAANAFDMKEAILFELGLLSSSITKTKLWEKLTRKGKGGQGYYVFKAMLEELSAEGKVVVAKEKGHGGQAEVWRISLVASAVQSVY